MPAIPPLPRRLNPFAAGLSLLPRFEGRDFALSSPESPATEPLADDLPDRVPPFESPLFVPLPPLDPLLLVPFGVDLAVAAGDEVLAPPRPPLPPLTGLDILPASADATA